MILYAIIKQKYVEMELQDASNEARVLGLMKFSKHKRYLKRD